MRLRIVASTLAALAVAGCAVAQTPKADEDHSAHHPPGSPPPAAAAPRAAAPDAFDKQMKAMQDMHQRMQAAKTPTERAALMDEHMKLLQSGMAMMGQMRGMGGPGATGGSGGMGMHQQMERRMAMMEQMMVDREAVTPPK